MRTKERSETDAPLLFIKQWKWEPKEVVVAGYVEEVKYDDLGRLNRIIIHGSTGQIISVYSKKGEPMKRLPVSFDCDEISLPRLRSRPTRPSAWWIQRRSRS